MQTSRKNDALAQRLKGYGDNIRNFDLYRGDTQQAIFAQHLVLATLKEVFRHEFAALKFVNNGLIPWDTSVPAGALSVGWYDLDRTTGPGDGIVADDAEDIPAVDLAADFHTNRAVTVAKAFKYSLQDVETAAMQGLFSLVNEKSTATREEHDRDLNNLVRNGSNDGSIPGLYQFPGIQIEPAITGTWATATADQITADFNTAVTSVMSNTEGRGEPDTALFSIAAWRRINTQLGNAAGGNDSILKRLQLANPFITRWDWENGLVGVGDGGTDSVLIYKNQPSTLRAVLPMRMVPLAPQERGLSVKVILRSRYAGIVVPRPREIVRLDGV